MTGAARLWRRIRARQQMVGAYLREAVAGSRSATPLQAHARLRARIDPPLRRLVGDAIGVDGAALGTQTSLTEDLAMDSLDVLDVVIQTEAEFGIVFPDREVGVLRTYGDLVDTTTVLAAHRLHVLESERGWAGVEVRFGAAPGEIPRFLRVLDATPYDRELLYDDVRFARTTDTIEINAPRDATAETVATIERLLVDAGATAIASEATDDATAGRRGSDASPVAPAERVVHATANAEAFIPAPSAQLGARTPRKRLPPLPMSPQAASVGRRPTGADEPHPSSSSAGAPA
jgi:acyl carrier protein